ncbi:unnamed protein product [Miscanthus lutarioriparius]|uniref:Uncharacterized protein n=1 Tax=Miscanthus lutarioriparius TaxID=422564 RepID=A0A811QRT3_9POAL|nr:unnamed protein product [Miscanthus lutarioriparius]
MASYHVQMKRFVSALSVKASTTCIEDGVARHPIARGPTGGVKAGYRGNHARPAPHLSRREAGVGEYHCGGWYISIYSDGDGRAAGGSQGPAVAGWVGGNGRMRDANGELRQGAPPLRA